MSAYAIHLALQSLASTHDAQATHEPLSYRAFLEAKVPRAVDRGYVVDVGDINPWCKPHQRDLIAWAVRGGRRGIFSSFGLGKTGVQLETCRLVLEACGGRGVISAPLGVRQEFFADAQTLGIDLRFIRRTEEMVEDGLYITNHESVREGKVSLENLTVCSIDEASCLRGLGTKTFREFYRKLQGTRYRFVATATPAPNDYIEILNYAMVLGIMDIGEAKTRWFKRDSEKSDNLTLHPHKEAEFWLWVHSWAVFLQKPSELGYSDDGYELPPVSVNWHVVGVDHAGAGSEKNGQHRLLHDAALGVQEAAAAKRDSLTERIAKVRELIDRRPTDHVVIWHDLEDERRALERSIDDVVTVYGTQDLDEREAHVAAFKDGAIQRLASKPVLLGSGTNLQRHCHWAIFAGVGFKFNDFIQAIHRIVRFLQRHEVTIDIVCAESEAEVVKKLRAKWTKHVVAMERMSGLIRRYGLSSIEPEQQLTRSLGVTRHEERGDRWTAVTNDTVDETSRMPADSIDLVVTSIPFSTQYEYTPSYHDFGHTDDAQHFYRQMDYLTPELLRVLGPGRMCCVHVKDRVRPGGYDNRSFQSIDPFHANAILHYQAHGFVYMGMITVVTDVVRENAGTYRLAWTEQCKDGSRMSVGLPEYVLLFRKPPTDNASGYADEPVKKTKAEYTKGRWQIDAHAFWKSNGNRLLEPEDLVGQPWKEIFNQFRGYTLVRPYDHEQVVRLAEALDEVGQLPPDFMLLQPAVDHPDVWCDVTRMRSLNSSQASAGREKHLCPLPFDIVDRLINRFSNPDDLVFDPFGGLGTVALRALQLGRRGLTVELNQGYSSDAARYLRAAENQDDVPTLFDAVEP